MKCIVLHESSRKMRIKVPQLRMSLREADIIEYYLRSLTQVRDVCVYDRTQDVVITFETSTRLGKSQVVEALEQFSYQDEKITALVPEETGRAMNRMYEEKLVYKIGGRIIRNLFFPPIIRNVLCVAKSIPYIVKGIGCLIHSGLEVEVLDATAITASILRKDYATASSVMFLLTIGEILEEWTRKKSVCDLAKAMCLDVDKVWVQSEAGEVLVDVRNVKVGDRIILRNSNLIPLDGVVLEGEMTVNQSTMTGEAEPVIKSVGAYVYAGTVVEEGECIVEVKKSSGQGKYDQIVKMIESSEKLKSETETKAYSLADRLVPYSFVGAATTYLLTRNVNKAMSFMMVDFSCAMKLSMPLAVLSAIRDAREQKISVKGGKFMEAVANADTIVFDKTGTLTHATPTLMDVVAFENRDPDEMLRVAACLEEHYPHSVANAIVKGAMDKGLDHEELHSKVKYIVAHGVSSTVNDEKVVIGSYHFVMEDEGCIIPEDEAWKLKNIKTEYSRIFMGIGGRLAAVLCIFDPLREDANEVIDRLHALGIQKICMMTGDNKITAQAVAKSLNLDEFYAEVLPEDKANFIKKEHEQGRIVIMVGDGVNDTPAISEADVGIAISDGAAITKEVADIMIASEDLKQLVTLRQLSQKLQKRIHGNYRFILTFNSALIAMGILGVLPPALSAVLHNGSTIYTGLKSTTSLLEPEQNNSHL